MTNTETLIEFITETLGGFNVEQMATLEAGRERIKTIIASNQPPTDRLSKSQRQAINLECLTADLQDCISAIHLQKCRSIATHILTHDLKGLAFKFMELPPAKFSGLIEKIAARIDG